MNTLEKGLIFAIDKGCYSFEDLVSLKEVVSKDLGNYIVEHLDEHFSDQWEFYKKEVHDASETDWKLEAMIEREHDGC